LYAFNRGDRIVLDVDRAHGARLIGVFDHYIVMDDVVIEDGTNQLAAIGVQGPKARAVLEAAGIAVPGLEPLQFSGLTWQGSEITLVRTEAWKGEAYEIWVAPEQVPVAIEALEAGWGCAGGRGGTTALSDGCGNSGVWRGHPRARFAAGDWAGAGVALRQGMLCRPGNCRAHSLAGAGASSVSGFELTAPCVAGDKIEADGKEVGEITSTANFSGQKKTGGSGWAIYGAKRSVRR